MNRLGVLILTIILVAAGATLALGASSNMPDHQGNAAVTEYVPKPPVTYTPAPPPPTTPETHHFKHHKKKHHEVKSKHEEGGKPGSKGQHAFNGNGNSNGNGNGNGNGESETEAVSFENASTGPSGGAGGLPFTGFDLIGLFAIGLLMIGIGVGQRRLAAPRRKP